MKFWSLLVRLPWQTSDNNRSWVNKKENLEMSIELTKRALQIIYANTFMSKTILKNHIVDWAYKNEKGLFLKLKPECLPIWLLKTIKIVVL